MDRQDSKDEPILSPIQTVDLAGYEPKGELKPVPVELIRQIADTSNAHSAIIITSTQLIPGQPGKFEIAQFNCDDHTFEQSINNLIHILTNMVEGIRKSKPQ